MVIQKIYDFFRERADEPKFVHSLFFFYRKDGVCKWDLRGEVHETVEQLLPFVDRPILIGRFAADERRGMQTMILKSPRGEVSVKPRELFLDAFALVVKEHRHQIIRRALVIFPEIARFVYENA